MSKIVANDDDPGGRWKNVLGVERAAVNRGERGEEEVDSRGNLRGQPWKNWPREPEVRCHLMRV